MAISDTFTNISNISVYGDLYGSILEPKVISIANVQAGILRIENGGTGLSIIPNGQLFIGKNNKIGFLTGSLDGQSIVWSNASSSWITARVGGLTNLNLEIGNNLFFNSSNSYTIDNIKTYNLTQKTQSSDGFLATDLSGNRTLVVRKIDTTDFPSTLDSLNLTRVNTSGSHYGTFVGNSYGNFSGIYSGSYSGDGRDLINLDPTKIINFNQSIITALSSIDVTLDNVIATRIISPDGNYGGVFNGSFSGDGAGLTNLPVKQIYSNNPNVVITSDGEMTLSNNLSIASSINSPTVYSEKFIGNFSGDGSSLKNVPNSALKNPFIKLNDQIVELGQGISLGTDFKVVNTSSNLSVIYDDNNLTFDLTKNFILDSLNSDLIKANILSGNFYGNGAAITNINTSNIFGLKDYVVSQFSASGDIDGINIIKNNGQTSLNNNISLNSINTKELYSQTGSFTSGIFNKITTDILNTQELSASVFIGDGSRLRDISSANILGLSSYVRASFSGSDFIRISSNGVISLDKTLEGVTYVSAGKNLSGGGSGFASLQLGEDIFLNSVSASFITARRFTGDGSSLRNISYNNLLDLPSLSNYPLKTELTSTLSNYALKTELVGTTVPTGTDGQLFIGQTNSASLFKTVTGDITINKSGVATIANAAFVYGTFGNAASVPVFSTNVKGQVTTGTNTPISITSSQVSDFAGSVRDQFTAGTNVTIANGVISAVTGAASNTFTAITASVITSSTSLSLNANTYVSLRAQTPTNPIATGGDVSMTAGSGGTTSGNGGNIVLYAGQCSSGNAGSINLYGGGTSAGGASGGVNLLGGYGNASAAAPGDITIYGGSAANVIRGGAVTIDGGKSNSGVNGIVNIGTQLGSAYYTSLVNIGHANNNTIIASQLTASKGISSSFFVGDGSKLTNVAVSNTIFTNLSASFITCSNIFYNGSMILTASTDLSIISKNIYLRSYNPSTGIGGGIILYAGAGATNGNEVRIFAGDGNNGVGGDLNFAAGDGTTTAGSAIIAGGNTFTAVATGGNAVLKGGAGYGTAGVGGNVFIDAGLGSPNNGRIAIGQAQYHGAEPTSIKIGTSTTPIEIKGSSYIAPTYMYAGPTSVTSFAGGTTGTNITYTYTPTLSGFSFNNTSGLFTVPTNGLYYYSMTGGFYSVTVPATTYWIVWELFDNASPTTALVQIMCGKDVASGGSMLAVAAGDAFDIGGQGAVQLTSGVSYGWRGRNNTAGSSYTVSWTPALNNASTARKATPLKLSMWRIS